MLFIGKPKGRSKMISNVSLKYCYSALKGISDFLTYLLEKHFRGTFKSTVKGEFDMES